MSAIEIVRTRGLKAGAFAALGLLIGLVGPATAEASYDPVDLQVVNRDTGQPLKVWRHQGRLFIAGEAGSRYSLRVTNHTDDRVLVVMSVDGVNILTGKTASYDQQGYVFDAHQSYDVSGWRKSDTEVAAFSFAPLPQSYAARTGRPSEVGVIGMAVFREQISQAIPSPEPSPAVRSESRKSQSAPLPAPPAPLAPPPPETTAPAPAIAAAPGAPFAMSAPNRPVARAAPKLYDDKLGTAHGARERSVVTNVEFERATRLPQIIRQIEYDTYDHLVASGVIPRVPGPGRRPVAFPADAGEGFVPDPPG